jgi:tetratricopeptide (TPR) repeat protein
MRIWIVCVCAVCASIVWTGAAAAAPAAAPRVKAAAPRVSARAQLEAAEAQYGNGNYQEALALIAKGLAVAPRDLKLLGLRGTVLLELRDYPGALAAYQAFLQAGPTGAIKKEAEKIVSKLLAVQSTSLEITLSGGAGDVYLNSKAYGLFCRAAPSCKQAVLPDQYKVIVERPGFERWTSEVTVASGATTPVAVTLVEKPSAISVRAEPQGARVTVDGQPLEGQGPVAAGRHRVVVSLDGYQEEVRQIEAREGKPIELALRVPIRVEPAGAELWLDGQPIRIEGGRVAIRRGAHALVARRAGFAERRIEIPAERGADYEVAIELERERAAAAAEARVAEETRAGGTFTGRRKLAMVLGGAGLAAAGAGVVLGRQASQLEDDGDRRNLQRSLQSQLAYGAAGVAAAIAIGLWLDGAPGPRVSVAPRVGVGGGVAGAGIDLSGRF